MCKQLKLYHFLIPYTGINLKWNKVLNVRLKIINILKENLSSKITGNIIFSDITREIRENKSNWTTSN